MVTQKHNTILKRLYETVRLPNSYGGINTLLRNARKVDKSITRSIVKEFLDGQTSYTLHKVTLKKFRRRRILSPKPKVIASCDLADMSNLARHNKGFRYILVVIDVFSRFLQVVPLKRKDGITVMKALKSVFDGNNFNGVSRLNSDEGKEFYNKYVHQYLKRKKIKLYSVHSREIKASIAERVIRTLKSKIYRHLTHNNTLTYINALKDIVTSYNNSPHRGLGDNQTPAQIHSLTARDDIKQQFIRMYISRGNDRRSVSSVLTVGRTVRIADENRNAPFRRGFTVQNTYEIFKISKVDTSQHPPIYYLEDLNGEEIQGAFYREELIPTKLPELYDITVIRKKKINGRVKYLVKWSGYPDQFNSWVDESQIVQV